MYDKLIYEDHTGHKQGNEPRSSKVLKSNQAKRVESHFQSRVIGPSVVNNSFLVFKAARAARILLCSCSVCVAGKITATQRLCDPGPKHGEYRGKIRIASCPWGTVFWAVSAQQYHCHFGLSFIPTARHTRDTFSYCRYQVNFEIANKRK